MKRLALLEYCFPDYFSGYHLPVIAVPLFNGKMTNKDVSDGIREDIDTIYEMCESDEQFQEYESLALQYCEELEQSPEDVFIEWEYEEEYEEMAYLYFSIINPVYKYGIMFPNE